MVFSCECKAEIWVTKGFLVKAKENILGLEIIKDQSGNTLRVSLSRIHNKKLVQTLLKGHSTLSLEDSLSIDCDVEKNGKRSYMYAVGSQEYHMQPEEKTSTNSLVKEQEKVHHGADVGAVIMKTGVPGQEGAKAHEGFEAGYVTFTEAWKKEIWLKGLLTESRYELRLVAGIATGSLVKRCSWSKVPTQVKVAAYQY
nr:zinc finger, CCHC-type [Tanacetum cinerariifolium]